MDIGNQVAQNIYNVAGDIRLENSTEVAQLISQKNQERLEELYSISFFEVLKNDFQSRPNVTREKEVKNISEALEKTKQLIVYGEPGIGKTTTLLQVCHEFETVLYISVKGRSPLSIISYLVNKLRQVLGKDLLEFDDFNKALDWLQVALKDSHCHIILDDCEKDIETINKVLTLEKFSNKFLLGSRTKKPFEKSKSRFYKSKYFNEEEIRAFLTANDKKLSLLQLNEVIRVSKGNPLYLHYFINFPTSKLPDNLKEFQDSIWSELTVRQKELILFMSLTYFSISVDELAEFLEMQSPLELHAEIDNISSLVKIHDGVLVVFHPSFSDFVSDLLKKDGGVSTYLNRLGDYFLMKEEYIQATYLLIDISPEKIDDFLLEILPSVMDWGDLRFALKVLNTKLKLTNSDLEKGYINYHLCSVYNFLGNKEQSDLAINNSIAFLENAGDKHLLLSARMFKAMGLIHNGEIELSKKIADDVFSEIGEVRDVQKAQLLVNLSKIYVDLSEFKLAAKASKDAFDLFEKDDHREGMTNSAINLVSSMAQINEYKDTARIYGEFLLEITDRNGDFSAELIILNALTSVYRSQKKFEDAKKVAKKAIRLCQEFEMPHKAVLNLVNYGNIIRDEGNLDDAISIYNDALIQIKQSKLRREEGRVYWILADIERERGDLSASLRYCDKSILCSSEVNFYYGVANANREKSETLILMDKPIEAAGCLLESAFYYDKMSQFQPDRKYYLSKAIEIYYQNNEIDKADALVGELISVSVLVGTSPLTSLLESNADSLSDNVLKYFREYFSSDVELNMVVELFTLMNYCRIESHDKGSELFMDVVFQIIENLGKKRYSYSLLGFAIEQSKSLLQEKDLVLIYESLQEKLDFFSCRNLKDEYIIICSISGRINLEIRTFDDELICNKLALLLILIISEDPDLILNNAEFQEIKCVLNIWKYGDEVKGSLGKHLPETTFQDDLQTLHMEKMDFSLESFVIVNPEYETNSDLLTFSENKATFFFLIRAIIEIKSHFTHSQVYNDDEQRRFITKKISKLLDYTDVEETDASEGDDSFLINIDALNIDA